MPRKQAGEDNVCNPQPAVKVGKNANENAEIAKTGFRKQGLEGRKENVPIGRRFLAHGRCSFGEKLSDYTKSVSPSSIFAKHQFDKEANISNGLNYGVQVRMMTGAALGLRVWA